MAYALLALGIEIDVFSLFGGPIIVVGSKLIAVAQPHKTPDPDIPFSAIVPVVYRLPAAAQFAL